MKTLICSLGLCLRSLGVSRAASESDFAALKTFTGMGKEEGIPATGQEVELLRHVRGAGLLCQVTMAVQDQWWPRCRQIFLVTQRVTL
jgi:hypothetical protein